jgi:hypothetical protein
VVAGNDTTICQGTSATLNASSTGTSFNWFPSSSISNAHILNPTASPTLTTTYYLTALGGICSKTDSLTIFVNQAPIANAGIDTSTCYGKDIQLHGSGGLDYSWSPVTYLDNPTSPNPTVIKPLSTTSYHLTVTDKNNCQSLNNATVTVKVEPPPAVFAGNDTAVIINQPLQLNAVDINNTGFTNFLWTPADGLNNSSLQNPIS